MTLQFGPFHLDPDRRELVRDGQRVPITAKVLDTLVLLIENRERVVDKRELLDRLWPEGMVEEATLVQTVSMVRKTIGCSRGDGPRYIATIPGRGYQFVGEVISGNDGAALQAPAQAPVRPYPGWMPILLPVVAAGTLTAWWLRPSKTPAPQRTVPITSYPGREIFPSFSPDGKRIAFMGEIAARGNWDVYVKTIGEDAVHRLTQDERLDWSPAWSPDGRHIAFVRRDLTAKTQDLIVMPAAGGAERVILQGTLAGRISALNQLGRLVTWHPDSEHLIVTYAEHLGEPLFLHVVSASTGQRRKLTRSDAQIDGDMDPAVSHDGRRLAFRRKIEGWNSDVYVVDLTPSIEAAGEPVLVGRRMYSPVWGSDDLDLFMVESAFRPVLWRVSNGNRPERVREPAEAAFPAISSDGKRSAFSIIRTKVDIWQANLAGNPDIKPLISSTYIDAVPDYSPDGRKIAFASSRSGNTEVWVADSDGSNAVQLTHHDDIEADCPAWSPDGKTIAYHANQDNYRDVFVIDAGGGTPRRLTHREGLDNAPSWSRDGQWIYYHSMRSGERSIWKLPARGGSSVFVTTGTHAQESLDGTALFVNDDKGTLWTMPTAGGPRSKVFDRHIVRANFKVHERGIYFMGPRVLYFYDFASKTIRDLFTTPHAQFFGLALAPDASRIAMVLTEPAEADILMLDAFR